MKPDRWVTKLLVVATAIFAVIVACGFLLNLPWQLYVLAAAVYLAGQWIHRPSLSEKD